MRRAPFGITFVLGRHESPEFVRLLPLVYPARESDSSRGHPITQDVIWRVAAQDGHDGGAEGEASMVRM
jgi:hypothetical protein